VIGVSLVPAFGTLYQRLTLPESTRYIASQKLRTGEEGDGIAEIKRVQMGGDTRLKTNSATLPTDMSVDEKHNKLGDRSQISSSIDEEDAPPEELAVKKAQFTGTLL